jgi:helix-turn-helix protein
MAGPADRPTAAEREETKNLRKEVYGLRRANEILQAVAARNHGAHGHRETWLVLGRRGLPVGRDHVKRLMRQAGYPGPPSRSSSNAAIAHPPEAGTCASQATYRALGQRRPARMA